MVVIIVVVIKIEVIVSHGFRLGRVVRRRKLHFFLVAVAAAAAAMIVIAGCLGRRFRRCWCSCCFCIIIFALLLHLFAGFAVGSNFLYIHTKVISVGEKGKNEREELELLQTECSKQHTHTNNQSKRKRKRSTVRILRTLLMSQPSMVSYRRWTRRCDAAHWRWSARSSTGTKR